MAGQVAPIVQSLAASAPGTHWAGCMYPSRTGIRLSVIGRVLDINFLDINGRVLEIKARVRHQLDSLSPSQIHSILVVPDPAAVCSRGPGSGRMSLSRVCRIRVSQLSRPARATCRRAG
jgi:hypothetical protein